jgi:hypothetical protein
MAIGRTEDRNTPGNPLGRRPRRDVWDPIRVTHLGPRSTWPHTKAGHMTAIDQTRPQLQKVLARRGPSTQGFRMPVWRERSTRRGPASESLRRRNPREAGEQLAGNGGLGRQRRCRGMVCLRIAEG